MPQVKCHTLFNKMKYVDAETMIQRPSVYGIVLSDNKLLVARGKHTQRYTLPGGGIEKGEAIDAALIREIREETGVPVNVEAFLHFETDFFYYDPTETAYHSFLFFYQCVPLSTQLSVPDAILDDDVDMPLWVDINTLDKEAFQTQGALTMRLLGQLSPQLR